MFTWALVRAMAECVASSAVRSKGDVAVSFKAVEAGIQRNVKLARDK